jgi:hypothetical protein
MVVMALQLEKTNQEQVEQVVTLDLALVVEQVAQTMLTALMALLVAEVAVVILKAQAPAQHQMMDNTDRVQVLVHTEVVVVKVKYNINL